MKYKAVLFDMDGTVLDTLGDLCAAVNYTLRHNGLPERSEQEIAAALGSGAAWLISHCAPEGSDEALCAQLLEEYKPYYEAHCDILTKPYAGIIELMHELSSCGIKLALISNKQDAAVKLLAEKYFHGLLDSAVGESEIIRKKPNPDAVNAALQSMGIEAAKAIYVGDTEVDIQTAANCGMDCAAVCWGFRSRQFLADCGAEHLFETVEDLREYLLAH